MKAEENLLASFIDGKNKRFIIPVYQRPYSWNKQNCEQLLKDLKSLYENNYKNHFFGSIVYISEDMGGGNNEYTIIDGQQRLTSVSILLLAIRNYLLNQNVQCKIDPEEITETYLINKRRESENKLRLKLVQGDDDAYNRLIQKSTLKPNNNISLNFSYFYSEIEKLSIEEIENLYTAIEKLMVVLIGLSPQDGDDPQLIFESLNSTGLALEESDKIRNYVLMGLKLKDQEDIYKNYWEKLENIIGKKDTTKFIRHYLAIKLRDLPNEGKLYFEFKKYRNKSSLLSIQEILNDMIKYAEYYKMIKECGPYEQGYKGSFGRLMLLDVNTSIPLLFDLCDAFKMNLLTLKEINEAALLVESYYVRRMICRLPAASLNRTYVSIGAEVEKYVSKDGASYLDALKYSMLIRTGKTRFPNEHDFDNGFKNFEVYNAKSSLRKYILERLENSSSRERVAVEEQIDKGELTIEHIMPQTLNSEWKEQLGENWDFIHTKYLHTIGNLTLTAYNSDYSNLIFKKKKEMAEKGFNYSKLTLNEYLKQCDEWNEETINERSDILLEMAKKIWPLPITSFEHNVEEEWVDLDDEYDFTGKVIKKIVLIGDEIITSNITDVYAKVNETLYSLEPDIYSNTEMVYGISDKIKLRRPYEIAPTVFIETNLSSQSKINKLRQLFKAFSFENSELRFLVSVNGKVDNT